MKDKGDTTPTTIPTSVFLMIIFVIVFSFAIWGDGWIRGISPRLRDLEKRMKEDKIWLYVNIQRVELEAAKALATTNERYANHSHDGIGGKIKKK